MNGPVSLEEFGWDPDDAKTLEALVDADIDNLSRNGSKPADLSGPDAAAAPFAGISHAEALEANIDELPGGQLVEELIERGTVGTVAGIPETFKSWTAQATAVAIAHGEGEILGRRVLEGGNVGYFWQDDSRRNELERIQTLHKVRATPDDLPLRWFLNEGLTLPDDLERLRATIEQYGLVLACLDSFYNIAGGIDLKDEESARIVTDLKREVCDETGCTVLIVDHAPWPSSSNRGQARAYGPVFKGAAIRWGIYVTRDRSKLYVSASANNMRGLPRTPAYWDADALELRLVDTSKPSETFEEVSARTLDWLAEQTDWQSTTAVKEGVKGEDKLVGETLFDLFERGLIALSVGVAGKPVQPVGADEDADYRRQGLRRYWKAHSHAESESASPQTPTHADIPGGAPSEPKSASRRQPRRGDDSDADYLAGSIEEEEIGWADVQKVTLELQQRTGTYGYPLKDEIAEAERRKREGPAC